MTRLRLLFPASALVAASATFGYVTELPTIIIEPPDAILAWSFCMP